MDVIVRHAVVRGHQGMVDIVIEKDRIASVQPKAPGKGRREIDAA
jgi:dihydroorotase-like cyclic amidohydrolase